MRPLHYDLEFHLAFLLFQLDSLHVPGLGVFSVRRYGAEIQLPAGLILPPARRLSFAPEAHGDSSILLDHLCSIEGFSRAEAAEATDLCVAEWNRVLDRGDRLNLIGLGSLRRSDHAWVFKASIDANFLAASYGLPMFRMDLLQSADQALSAHSDPAAPRVRSWYAAAIVAGALGLAAVGGSKDDFRGLVQSASLRSDLGSWWSSQSSSVQNFAGEASSWASERFKSIGSSENDSEAPSTELAVPTAEAPASEPLATTEPAVKAEPMAEIKAKSEAKAEPEAKVEKPSAPAKAESTNAEAESVNAEAAEGYALIVGAFSEKANATRLVARLRKAGYPAKIVQSSVGLNKVALRTFAEEDSARKAKTELRADFPAVWIYRE
ncbi:MAG: SPOR domain-containing protein [Schleiferiaceae bacterium]|jgi:cell division septation protein DedD|nr:SPOR domain-containing protein [Schleiferiaceae bacterium]MDP4628499.1 SPOR domain-containing protein [Schleiferiaceae bacterium]MDP4742421.1 SPOR domain-containing protein [Schleiferiaceae bacterium]MDP4774147.1 SPOR domain-containing protein [Schleiferiaceae bacterium]MDP4855454.1 SPOR domain-containing protein [Schleiferiaceae bacterium]